MTACKLELGDKHPFNRKEAPADGGQGKGGEGENGGKGGGQQTHVLYVYFV